MNDDTGIRGRNKEINKIKSFITSKIDKHESGILYLAGAPGTGKTMSIQFVLNQVKEVTKVNLNCMKAQSSRIILNKICKNVGLNNCSKSAEAEMISRLSSRFSSDKPYIIVLDELDQLPKSKNVDLIKTIFSWPLQSKSRLILIGIANTLDLTSRHQVLSKYIGKEFHEIEKIPFRPYSTQDIKSILLWYLENDENFEDANVDLKILDMIASKYSREKNGDIRAALNALRGVLDDTQELQNRKSRCRTPEPATHLPTPPATPPSTPCKENKTNIAMLANSLKKRSKRTQYEEDAIPIAHQILMVSIFRLATKGRIVDSRKCKKLILNVLKEFGLKSMADDDYHQILNQLETQGLIVLKKFGPKDRIVIKVGESEITDLIQEKDKITSLLDRFC